jgi:Uma2 family endonuclease
MSTEITEEAIFQSNDRKPHPGRTMTWEEFHDWLDDKTHAEWVEGEIRIMAPASHPHQILVTFFVNLLTLYAGKHDLGEIELAPFQVRLGRSSREPDVIFVAKNNVGRFKRTYLDGAPDLVIEILSPSTRHIDRGEKYYEYEEAGVREYWMIDPDRQQAEFYRLNTAGRFEQVVVESGIFESQVVSRLRMEVAWLWNAPLANIHAIARAADAL